MIHFTRSIQLLLAEQRPTRPVYDDAPAAPAKAPRDRADARREAGARPLGSAAPAARPRPASASCSCVPKGAK